MKLKLATATGMIALIVLASPARAQIAYTGITVGQFDTQKSPTTVVPSAAEIVFNVEDYSPNNFTNLTVSDSGPASPEALSYSPQLYGDGTYQNFTERGFSSIVALNSIYPFGTYNFTAINSVTQATQSAALVYGSNIWPSAVPALTAASYSNLQALNAASDQTIDFNNFVGSGANPAAPNPSYDSTYTVLNLFNLRTDTYTYASGVLPSSVTSLNLPANTLAPGNIYVYQLIFANIVSTTGSPGYYNQFNYLTSGMFTTANGAVGPQTLAHFEGGTLQSPVGLPIVGKIGDVSGSIGGNGSSDIYQIYWSGGAFEASASLAGASPNSSYVFELINSLGNIQTITLDQTDGFSGMLNDNIGAGLYEVGIIANSPLDPSFNIQFDTPVQGVVPTSVPESTTWTMMLVGFMYCGAILRGSQRQVRTGVRIA